MANVFPIVLNGNQKRVYNPSSDIIPFSNYLNIIDQKAQNTNGGSFTSGAWRTRDLNTVRTNEIAGASLASNTITLPSGKYYVEWACPCSSDNNEIRHQSRLFNTTDNALIILGSGCHFDNTPGLGAVLSTTYSFGQGQFTLAATKNVQLQHIISSTENTFGFGEPANLTNEIYSQISIWKVSN